MKNNPFTTTINISARVMMENTDLDIKYVYLPPGVSAGYRFPDPPKQPRAMILLPKIDITRLDDRQRIMVSALCTHETRHHHWSTKEAYDKVKDDDTERILYNWLEDARIELIKNKTFIGAEQDLNQFNADDFKKVSDEYNKLSIQNRWAWLFSSFFYRLRNIGNLPIPDEMKEYDEIAWKILNDGRFETSIEKEKKGSITMAILAKEILNAFQEKRNEEYEEEQKEKGESDKEGEGEGKGEGQGEGQGEGKEDGENQDEGEGEGLSSGQNQSQGNSKGKQNKESKKNETKNKYGNKKNQSASDNGDESSGENKEPKNKPEKNRDHKSDKSDLDQDDGEKSPKDNKENQSSGESDSMSSAEQDPDATNSEDDNSEDSDTSNKHTDVDGGVDKDNKDAGEDNKSDDGMETGQSSQDCPKSIREEFENAQNNDETKMSENILQQLVSALQNDKTLTGLFIPNHGKDKRDPFGDYYTETPDMEGSPYIPYTTCDKERIPDKKPVAFRSIEQSISSRTNILRRQLSTVLLARSQSVIERGHRKGQMDSRQYYKLLHGSVRVKKQVTPGIKLDTAVTLLVDLSGSMMGRKAALAVQVATLFGEALKNFKQIPFEILGYNSEELTGTNKSKATKNGYTRIESINYWLFKTFEEPWRLVRERMGATAHALGEGGTTGGCNCDHENLLHAAARLWNRKESQKVLIVLCDGAPSGYNGTYGGYLINGLHEAIARIRKSGIKLFCFGIKTNDVEEFYAPDVEIVQQLDDLNEKMLRKLAQFLLRV